MPVYLCLMFTNTLIEAHESSTPEMQFILTLEKAFDYIPHNELIT